MNKNDLRYIKTEKIIKESFKKCVKEHGFEKVTISMICEEGLISRNAFYLHFTDKYDLLDRMFDEFEKDFIKKCRLELSEDIKNKIFFNETSWYVDTVISNRKDFAFLIGCSRERVEEVMQKAVIEMPVRKIFPKFDEKLNSIFVKLNIKYILSAMVAYTELWLKNYDKISREDVIIQLSNLCNNPASMYIEEIKKEV